MTLTPCLPKHMQLLPGQFIIPELFHEEISLDKYSPRKGSSFRSQASKKINT